MLLKDAIHFTIKAVISGAFAHTDTEITSRFNKLRNLCPKPLTGFVFNDALEFLDEDFPTIVSTSSHLQIAVHGRLKLSYLQSCGLSHRRQDIKDSNFNMMMTHAMTAYGLRAINWGRRPLYWYENCSYTSQTKNKRCTLHVNDYVRLVSTEYVKIRYIFTHAFDQENLRRVFVWIQHLELLSNVDRLLRLSLYKPVSTEAIVPLSSIIDDAIYMIPTTNFLKKQNNREENLHLNLMHCNWNINFL